MVANVFTRVPVRAASSLLAFIAGEFADDVARLWPAPHADFFALPAARRHAAAIILAGFARRAERASVRRLVSFSRDADVAAAIADDRSHGLMGALAKAGERLWRRKDYSVFLDLLVEPKANAVLRHLDHVEPERFERIAALPPPLRQASIVRVLPSWDAAADLALAFRLAVRMREPASAARIASSWSAGGDAHAVFRRAVEDLTPDAFHPAGPAPALPPPFVRIVARKQLESVALEFRNCLADHAARMADGRMAAYVWRTDPAAAIALAWDAAGWRLAEAKAVDNGDLPEPALMALVKHLEPHGVRTGISLKTLVDRLEDHGSGSGYVRPLGREFVDQLALGDLWT